MARFLVLFLFLAVGGVLIFFLSRPEVPQTSATEEPTPQQGPPEYSDPVASPADPHPAFKDYGSPATTARDDLRLLHGFVSSSFLIVKNHDPRHHSTNEDLVLFLQGKNPHREVILPAEQSPPQLLNPQGQLIDRWGSPLIVHPISKQVLELRSPGPDRIPYNEDDLAWPPTRR